MKIIYLTTSMVPVDFNRLTAKTKYPPNPSNQNFHHKLILALSMNNDVEVIVNRPLSYRHKSFRFLPYETSLEGYTKYHYVGFFNSRFGKPFSFSNKAKKIARQIIKSNTDIMLVVDSLNYSLVKVAQTLSMVHRIPIVGVITDNPMNLSSTKKKYVNRILGTFPYYDLYLTLTEGLNQLANPFGNPHYTFPGLVQDSKSTRPENDSKTLFFAGSIYERYGIKNLITAFNQLPDDYHLLIAGQGPEVNFVKEEAKKNPRIQYLGLLSPQQLAIYEQNAFLNINPRPFNSDLDMFSIPSKVLEYAESGSPTLSTRSSVLENIFPNEILWAGSGKTEELVEALNKFIALSPSERRTLGDSARKIVLEHYSIEIQAPKISHFIKSIK